MPGQIPDPSLAPGAIPSLGPLAGVPGATLTEQLRLADLHTLGAMISPLHFLSKLGKRPSPLKEEVRVSGVRSARGCITSGYCDDTCDQLMTGDICSFADSDIYLAFLHKQLKCLKDIA